MNYQELQRTEKNPTANITKRGFLRLTNSQSQNDTRVFVQTNQLTVLNPIGRLVCSEMGFSRLLNVVPTLVSASLRSQMSDSSYLNNVNVQNLNGLKCDGTENSIKECQVSMDAQLDTSLYELDIECACKSENN